MYNTKQAQTAIALGGLTGQGYSTGQYTKGGFVPEQQTDFIFTVPGRGARVRRVAVAPAAARRHRLAGVADRAAGPRPGRAGSSASACCACSCSTSSRTSA